jgi:hypothetical protein
VPFSDDVPCAGPAADADATRHSSSLPSLHRQAEACKKLSASYLKCRMERCAFLPVCLSALVCQQCHSIFDTFRPPA